MATASTAGLSWLLDDLMTRVAQVDKAVIGRRSRGGPGPPGRGDPDPSRDLRERALISVHNPIPAARLLDRRILQEVVDGLRRL